MSYEWTSHNHNLRPEVTRRAIAGLWRLTPRTERAFPMKEFTVYPKKKNTKNTINQQEEEKEPELLLMLKEDGSFQQYAKTNDDDNDDANNKESSVDADVSWQRFQEKRQAIEKRKDNNKLVDNLVKGIWDYRDGNLILAADRPDEKEMSLRRAVQQQNSNAAGFEYQDTLLVGRVVATYGNSLEENPALAVATAASSSSLQNNANNDKENDDDKVSRQDQSTTSTSASTSPTSSSNRKSVPSTNNNNKNVDAHLSVPKGSLNVGKFFYPKTHPSFFEQPIYNPKRVDGSFQLRQVLGSLNTRSKSSSRLEDDDEDHQTLFERRDFYNKTFWLTSHPIGKRKPKGNMRWSIKYNKFVHDPPNKKQKSSQDDDDDDDNSQTGAHNIRVLQVLFFPNNTFCTVAGIGDAAILRGKFDVIGQDKDHLWMQVMRFGFGRSVSGSVYSEGRMLTQDDAKAYWGKITKTNSSISSSSSATAATRQNTTATLAAGGNIDSSDKVQHEEEIDRTKLEVNGSVMLGWGLEPLPVARFIMKELEQVDHEEDVDDDDDDDDEEDEDDSNINNLSSSSSFSLSAAAVEDEIVEGDGIDWSNNDGFQ